MEYQEALNYIRSRFWKDSVPDLGRTRRLLDRVGNPEQTLRFVHIAGTNGKGSVAAMCASILRNADYRVGLYTSPSLERYNERIQVNGEMIPDEALAALTETIQPLADSMDDPPTEFEMLFALALLWFKRSACDIVVLETGMGGEMDTTNTIPFPEVAVITAIGLDHMDQLGNTVEEIARTKAGIIKHGRDVVLNGNSPEANAVIASICELRHANLIYPDYSALVKSEISLRGQYFTYKHYNGLFLPLIGDYQPQNAAVAIETILALKRRGWILNERNIRDGLRATVWPGRFELLSDDPVFIADGAHNPQGIRSAAASVRRLFPDRKPVVLLGLMADKDVDGILSVVPEFAESAVCAAPATSRALPARELCERLRKLDFPAVDCASVAEGVEKARAAAKAEGRAVIALGSLYLVGEVRGLLRRTPPDGV